MNLRCIVRPYQQHAVKLDERSSRVLALVDASWVRWIEAHRNSATKTG